jgi:hypothetical protein
LVCLCTTVESQNLAYYKYFLVEKSHVAFVTFCGHCQDTPYALHMFFVQVPSHHDQFAVEQLPGPLILFCFTSDQFNRSSRLHAPFPVVSIRQASSASANTSSYAAVLFWWLSPSPCWVHPLRTADPALYLHHPYFTGPANHRQWQGHWNCLRLQRSSPEMSFWALSS